MAQLVKLQDYVSRYQIDLTRYPAQFVRMKKSGWERVKKQWESGEEPQKWEHIEETEEEQKERFSFIKKFFSKKHKDEEETETESEIEEVNDALMNEDDDVDQIDEDTTLLFEPNIVYNPQSIEELRKIFIDQFFHFQIKWASSTLLEKSFVDPKYLRDNFLRTVLQKFPDNYLVLYNPIVKVKKAPVELDVIILTPLECVCITVVEHENLAVYFGKSERERFWTKKVGNQEVKILNPLIQLNRMEAVVSQFFIQGEVDLPIRKILLSRNGYFDYPGTLFNVHIVDKRDYLDWFGQLKRSKLPMKRMQLLAAKTLLNNVQTTSYSRI